jgi:ribosomal-protein-alanine N-acetyltransferase
MIQRMELRTKRLLLRAFRATDVDDAVAYRNDPEFARFLPHIPQPFTREHGEAFVSLNMSEPWDQSPVFAVVLNGTLIGTVNLELDHREQSAMLGYAIGRAWWGLGIAAEAARAILTWASNTFRIARFWAATDIRNLASQRVMEKLGMQREALRTGKHIDRDGTPVEEVVYGSDHRREHTDWT